MAGNFGSTCLPSGVRANPNSVGNRKKSAMLTASPTMNGRPSDSSFSITSSAHITFGIARCTISPTTFTKVLRGNPNRVTFDIGRSNAAAGLRPYGNLTFRQSPRPGERAKCSAWAIRLGYRATAIEPGANHLMQKTGESQYRRFESTSGFGAFQASQ